MRNFTCYLFISFLLFSCSKNHEDLGNNTGYPPTQPAVIPPTPAPVTQVTILIDDIPMNITSLTYERHGNGTGGGMTITATNNIQKVTAQVFNFYQSSPWNMMYTMEVSYFARADSLTSWGSTYPRPVPRDDRIEYDNFTPLSDSVVTGNFSASFLTDSGPSKEKKTIKVNGNFKLVFIK